MEKNQLISSALQIPQNEFSVGRKKHVEYEFGPRIKIHSDQVFYENDHVFAFVNIRPVLPGHVLVSPKKVIKHFKDLSKEELLYIFKTGQMIGKAFSKHFKSENFHYTVQDGLHAGQTVPHVHLHVLPAKDHAIGEAEVYGNARSIDEMKEEAMIFRKLLEEFQIKL